MTHRLEAAGLLEQRVDPRDRRSRVIRLDSAGSNVAEGTASVRTSAQERILAPLAPAERPLFVDMLARLVEAHEAYARPGTAGGGRRVAWQPPQPIQPRNKEETMPGSLSELRRATGGADHVPSSFATIMSLVNGYQISQALHVVAVLGIADFWHSSRGPATSSPRRQTAIRQRYIAFCALWPRPRSFTRMRHGGSRLRPWESAFCRTPTTRQGPGRH